MEPKSSMTSGRNLSSFGNTTVPDGCVAVWFSAMEFLPWRNPDNIVSEATEDFARRFKGTLLVFMFLIGGPGNVINMAVFYRQSLKDRVNLCLFTLSLADEIYLIAALLVHGEGVYSEFTGEAMFRPMTRFLVNNNLNGFMGFGFVSFALSAIIATERCMCIVSPLKYATFMRTKTTAVVVVSVITVVVGLFFLVVFRYTVHCVLDLDSGVVIITPVEGEFYSRHKDLINYLDIFVYGVGIPGGTVLMVTAMTMVTTIKLRRVVMWRSTETSSTMSSREIALTKMLIGNSIFFILCVGPNFLFRFVCLFLPEMKVESRHHNFFLLGLWISESSSYINSTFNIVIYYVMGSRYRDTFWTLFSRGGNHKSEVRD